MIASLGSVVLFTLAVAVASTLLVAIPGVLLAWALATPGWRGRVAVETLVSLPLVLPPTAIGLGLLMLLGDGGPLAPLFASAPALRIAFTWKGVVVACAVVAMPLFVGSFRTALEEVDPDLVTLARTLGRSPVRCFLEVQLPLAWRGLSAGLLLAFARALGEFGATMMLAGNIPGRTQTLALALFQLVQVGRERQALLLAAISALLASVALFAADRFRGGSRRRSPAGDR